MMISLMMIFANEDDGSDFEDNSFDKFLTDEESDLMNDKN